MTRTRSGSNGIAVVGMACVYPGALNPEELWQNVLAGRRQFRKFPDERLPREGYYDPDPEAAGKSYSDQMAVVTGWSIDPVELRIPPVTFHAADIVHWLALHTAQQALRDSGIDLQAADRTRIAVMLGNTLTGEFSRSASLRFRWPYTARAIRNALTRQGYPQQTIDELLKAVAHYYLSPIPEINEDSLAGNMSNTIAGRICGYFDFGGGGFILDGACSSSLLAIAHACNDLVNGDIDIALSGGVDVSLDPFEIVGFAKTKALAADDVRPYDERADGMLPGEGCGMFVLMREAQARAEGRAIHAVIRGWGYSSDGRGAITAPRVEGQMRAIAKTYEKAGYPINDVGLFEGHGTGTNLGDRVEITALRNLLEAGGRKSENWIGSIKGDIGHCKAAAGAAGLIKAIMALKRRIIPPTGNCAVPSTVFGCPFVSLRPALEGRRWESGEKPRRASVSAMGFGGANAHLALEEAHGEGSASDADLSLMRSPRQDELVVLAAASVDALAAKASAVRRTAERISRAELADVAAALAKEGQKGDFRIAVIADSPWQLADRLAHAADALRTGKALSDIDDPTAGLFAGRTRPGASFVALFPGQGSQRLNMGRDLARAYKTVGELFAAADCAVADVIPGGLSPRLFFDLCTRSEEERQAGSRALRDTRLAQPAIVVTSLAVAKVISLHGLLPKICLGHSLGEISALCAASALDDLTAVRLAALRGRIMAGLPDGRRGGMAAIGADRSAVTSLLDAHAPGLVISNYNSPQQTVVSGYEDEIDAVVAACRSRDIRAVRLPVSHAFHSSHVRDAAEEFRRVLEDVDLRPLSTTVLSAATASEAGEPSALRRLLHEQITTPVRFLDTVLLAAEKSPDFWVEVGPGSVLSGLVREILHDRGAECFTTDEEGVPATSLLNRVFGRAFVLGCPLDTASLFAERFSRPVDPYDYRPVLIVNPCERPVQPLPFLKDAAAGIAAVLMPEGVDSGRFGAYLAERKDYLRELIGLDFRHHAGSPAKDTGESARAQAPEVSQDRDIMDYAIDWLAKRTGYPSASITPSMKLGEDLHLDSIKAGELALILARKMKLTNVPDPGRFASSTIEEIFRQLGSSASRPAPVSAAGAAASAGNIGSLGDWNAAFRIRAAAAPSDGDEKLPLPAGSAAIVVAAEADPRAGHLLALLREAGVKTSRIDYAARQSPISLPEDLSYLVVVLPEEKSDFLLSTPELFSDRVEGLALFLYSFFRNVLQQREHGLSGLRCLIVRPCAGDADPAADLDGGAGFLKTLKLEYPGFDAKWLCLPAGWSDAELAGRAAQELTMRSAGTWFRYTADGERLADVAEAVERREEDAVPRGVMLVTGGAKGITFELACALARKTGIALGLLGTSPLSGSPAGSAAGELPVNLARLAEWGIRHRYVACDVTDRNAVRCAIDELQKTLGPVTMVLHGAGLTRPAPFLRMEISDYLHCIRVKAQGLYNILSLIPPAQLKAVHVLSSVLGRTGMQGQADYCFANAWLDGAVQAYSRAHPHVSGFSLGYSVWSDAGIGKRMGAASALAASGVVPVSTERGIAIYLDLALKGYCGTFIGTGRLGGLDALLYGRPRGPAGRFTGAVLRFIPCAEIVTEAELSHDADAFLPEHVFQGTALMPAVIGIEAMVSAAMSCAASSSLPVVRDARFLRPIIVPEDATVRVRVMGIRKETADGNLILHMAVRSDLDGYRESHFEADCRFGGGIPSAVRRIERDALPAAEPVTPGMFEPLPLFQGKLFRRITALHLREIGSRGITTIRVPEHAIYFGRSVTPETSTPSPAVRDSCLQSAGLILPEMCLPAGISEIVWHRRPEPGEELLCESVMTGRSGQDYAVRISVFGSDGEAVEELGEVLFRPVRLDIPARSAAPPEIPAIADSAALFGPLFRDMPYAGILDIHENSAGAAGHDAGVKAAVLFARRHLGLQVTPDLFAVGNEASGKPHLTVRERSLSDALSGIDITLSDSGDLGMAVVGPPPLGIDLEPVEMRDAEMWQGLLGPDGYGLARRISHAQAEPFDISATRVWTLIEAGKKALALKRRVPQTIGEIRSGWMNLSDRDSGLQFYSTVAALDGGRAFAVCVAAAALEDSLRPSVPESGAQTDERVDAAVREFMGRLDLFGLQAADDPDHPDTDAHHAAFNEMVTETLDRLQQLSAGLSPERRRACQRGLSGRLLRAVRDRLDSVPFRRALEKPLGYPGDYLLMDMMLTQEVRTRGLGYHLDRKFIEYPGSEGVRRRTYWVVDRIMQYLAAKKDRILTVLDLGCGPMTIEKMLADRAGPDAHLTFLGLDVDPQAIAHARSRIRSPNCAVELRACNLLGDDGMQSIRELAPRADICVCMGFFDYLDSETIVVFLESVRQHLGKGTPILFANYRQDHPAQPAMEWLLDWWLVYKTEGEMRAIAEKAGFSPAGIWTGIEGSGCVILVEAQA